jgi:hypothetical protein
MRTSTGGKCRHRLKVNKGVRDKPIINGPVLSSACNASHSHHRTREKKQNSLKREEKEGAGREVRVS